MCMLVAEMVSIELPAAFCCQHSEMHTYVVDLLVQRVMIHALCVPIIALPLPFSRSQSTFLPNVLSETIFFYIMDGG